MKGYYAAGTGGALAFGEQIVAEIDLPAGRYLVFAKATVAISSRAPKEGRPETQVSGTPSLTVAYRARLVASGAPAEGVQMIAPNRDDHIGGLRWSVDDPGSRSESVALQIAVESSSSTRVTLRFFGTTPDAVFVWGPRISAIEVDEIQVLSSSEPHVEHEEEPLAYAFRTSLHPSFSSVVRGDDD